MSAARYVHPEFGFFCPTPRLRGLVWIALLGAACAAIGMAVLATNRDPDGALETAHLDGDPGLVTSAEATPPVAMPELWKARAEATAAPVRVWCADQAASTEGKCVNGKARKIRMVRVATERPAIASVPIGRSPAPSASTPEAVVAASAVAPATPAASRPAQTASTDAVAAPEPRKPAAASRKSQRTAQSRRREQSAGSSWREVRMDDWGARNYGSYDRGYQRGSYGRQGFFW
jgi:hypothetical protein